MFAKEECSKGCCSFVASLDLDRKTVLIKYTDDAEVDGLTDNKTEVAQSNMGSLVSRMNMQLTTVLIYSHVDLYI